MTHEGKDERGGEKGFLLRSPSDHKRLNNQLTEMNPSDRAGLRSCIRPSFPSGIERSEREELGRRGGLPQRSRIFETDRIVSRWNTAACPATKNRALISIQRRPAWWRGGRVIYGFRRRGNRGRTKRSASKLWSINPTMDPGNSCKLIF